jgi:hypothetical protein
MTYKIDRDRETGRGVTGCLRTATTLGVPGRAVDRSRNGDRMLRRAVRLARAGFLRHATYHQAVFARSTEDLVRTLYPSRSPMVRTAYVASSAVTRRASGVGSARPVRRLRRSR